MSTIEQVTPASTSRHAAGAERAKFLRKVLREDGWVISARKESDWNVRFHRTIRGKIGEPDIEVDVIMDDKVCVQGRFGQVRSFSDSEEVYIPEPTRIHLSYASVHTVARMLLDGCFLYVLGSAGSTSSSKHGLAFLTLECRLKGIDDRITIGHPSVYVNGRMVICGTVE